MNKQDIYNYLKENNMTGVVLSGRPYHVDPEINHGLADLITGEGMAVLTEDSVCHLDKELEEFLIERGKESFIPQVTNLSGKAKIHFIEEEGGAKGLGHAIYMAKDFVGNEPFAIMYGDVIMQGEKPCLKEIIEQHEKLGASIIGVEKVEWKDVPKYGNVSGELVEDRLYKVEKMQEKPKVEETKSNLAQKIIDVVK